VPELSARADAPDRPASVLRGLEEFREHLGGRLTIMLLRGIGDAFDVHEIRPEVMIRSIGVLTRIEAARASSAAGDEMLLAAPARGVS
jgi:3-dehydroquinate synthase